MNIKLPYKRILLKLSGEILMGSDPFGINHKACLKIALALREIRKAETEVGIVIGGGNIFRGINQEKMGMQRSPADLMGMLATMINGLALQQALTGIDCPAKVMSALECPRAVDSYSWRGAQHYFKQGYILIFVGGTGNPYFTTDTAAALRASEIQAEVFLKATKVDGVYDKDPLQYPDAKKYKSLSYSQALAEKLGVMDATSIALCRSNKIPMLVFNMNVLEEGKVLAALSQKDLGTIVDGD